MLQATQTTPERVFVKWATPAEEAYSTVRLAKALADRRIAQPEEIAIAVPNAMWAHNMVRAAESAGVAVSFCIPQTETPAVQEALAKLESAEAANFKGLSLAHWAGLDKLPECAHALLHSTGTEHAQQLAQLVRSQLHQPSVAENTNCIPIMLASNLRSSPLYLFVVACVNGLLPQAAAFEAENAADRAQALEAGRTLFNSLLETNRVRTTVSYFVKAPAEFAQQARIQISRYKTENGQRYAMVAPSQYITEIGSSRPSTTGGQALLRMYGLN